MIKFIVKIMLLIAVIIGIIIVVGIIKDKVNAQERVLIDQINNVQRQDLGGGNSALYFYSFKSARIEKDNEWFYQISGSDTIKYKLNIPIGNYYGRYNEEGIWIGEFNNVKTDSIEYNFDDKTEKEIKNNGLNIKKNGKVIARHSFSDGYYNALGNKVSIKSFETKENKIKIKFNREITTSKSDSFYWSSPSQDTKTVSGAPTTNYGTQASSYVGTRSDADVRNMMGWFKFGGLLNDSANAFAIIDSAFLSIKYYDTKVGLCTLFTVTPIAGWSQINLTFANQPDSSLAYISDTLKSNSAGWWRFNITTIETAYHTGGALSGLDTTKGYIIMDINPSDPASNYMNYFNSENATDKPKKVVYYHAGVATGGYIGNQPLYDNKNIPIYDNKITPLYNKP